MREEVHLQIHIATILERSRVPDDVRVLEPLHSQHFSRVSTHVSLHRKALETDLDAAISGVQQLVPSIHKRAHILVVSQPPSISLQTVTAHEFLNVLVTQQLWEVLRGQRYQVHHQRAHCCAVVAECLAGSDESVLRCTELAFCR